jgi:succinate-semialdehyde dehydrogenase/glutarate-semialdehyde dehydrogenase
MVYINSMTESTPEIPFGGAKNSGYGRELSRFGIQEFTNVKTVWIDESAEGASSVAPASE